MTTFLRRFVTAVVALLAPASLVLVLGALVAPSAAGVGDRDPGTADEAVPVGVWPLQPQPEVVNGFDPPDSPYGSGHRGVDLAGYPGESVRAALPGRVSFAGSIGDKPVVVVDHGATRTTYEPVAATVRVGQRVTAGAVIGRLVVAGSHCFPAACLHWGWIRNADDVYLDPLLLVGGGPVRLLPLDGADPAPSEPPAPLLQPYAGWRPPALAA